MPIGPSKEDLSPMKQKSERPRFPVLSDLTDKLTDTTDHPDRSVRYALATCAGYSYSDEKTVAMMMARMGLFKNHCAAINLSNDALFIDSTAFLVQSKDGKAVILCYRGTPPLNFIDWLLNADISPEKLSLLLPPKNNSNTPHPDHWVHSGFYRNMRATRFQVMQALDRALRGKSVLIDHRDPMPNTLEALYITGHSLGGAMAALMAIILSSEPAYEEIRKKLKAVYTFGQPMVGPPGIAKYWENLQRTGKKDEFAPLIRYIHRSDVVPHLPPSESGIFAHFGDEYRYQDENSGRDLWKNYSNTPSRQANLAEFTLLAPANFLAQKVMPLRGAAEFWNGVAGGIESNSINNLESVRRVKDAIRGLPFGEALTRLPLVYSFDDHSPNHYISKLATEEALSEFGDVR